jgi:carboxyl-terminal processing protease
LEDQATGHVYDTGIRVAYTNGEPIVVSVEADSAAAEAGVSPPHAVLELDGQSARAAGLSFLRGRLCSREPGEVRLRLQDPDEDAPREFRVEKRRVRRDAIELREELPLDLAYLSLNGLFEGSGTRVADALRSWSESGRYGAVLDLRGASGRDTASAAEIVSLFAGPDETLFSFRDAAGEVVETYRGGAGEPLGIPLMVLVDEHTIGASEVLAAALAGSGRGAMLLGARTAGDPAIRERIDLPGGEEVYLTTRRLVIGNGAAYTGGQGVKPDVLVVERDRSYRDYEPPPSPLGDRRETAEDEEQTRRLRQRIRGDVALTRAVDVLLGLKALDIHGFGFTPSSSD